ncbi:PstS family phosphate ABC transporter substrate-binding protein [Bacillus sp. FJAT-27225]|uniref:PstS family phosphate ABC transporter substrate-binding protein n=1 Tax=Bacillus sp. FJAT-27225 TaxID=1743144 RepID=UPI000B1A9DB8|nr:substrate-binding domain-containing protein [Bacillus sp. FJAT-27225]
MKRNTILVLLYFLFVPFVISVGALGLALALGEATSYYALFLYIASGIWAGVHFAKKDTEPKTSVARFLPVSLPALVAVSLGAVLMLATKGFVGENLWGVYVFGFFPFLPYNFITFLTGLRIAGLLAPFLYYFMFLLAYLIYHRRALKLSIAVSGTAVFVLCITTIGITHWHRIQEVLPSYGFKYENGYSSVDLEPYYVHNENNKLPKLNEPATFSINNQEEMPVLDGAEAAFPVYSAFANAVYTGISDIYFNNKRQIEVVSFTNTIYAFERLVKGEVDIFFGAQPSQEQKQLAERFDKELVLTPIGKEAFVFFVNSKNSVDNLATNQIRDIYSGKLTNCNAVGGSDEKIRAFQRPQGSGSQTIMQVVMSDTPLMDPLKEEVSGMGDLIEEVANYRNYKNALGYSFRFFTTGMNPSREIKLLSIDGVEPNEENIRSGKYPFVVNLYAITIKDNPNKHITPFLEWMQGPQGQQIVGEIGYVPLKMEGRE